MQEALQLVRNELGPDATVLSTRELSGGLFGRLVRRASQVEVTASTDVTVPSLFATPPPADGALSAEPVATAASDDTVEEFNGIPPAERQDYRALFRQQVATQNSESFLADLVQEQNDRASRDLPVTLFRLFTDLLDAEVDEPFARELVEAVRREAEPHEIVDPTSIQERLLELLRNDISISGPIQVTPSRRRVVALIGPTGVGKTTTIAKLAANFRLRDKHRVGLITVDTYRIAAVEQLRTYADIIDLPMEVVSTPKEMRDAVMKLCDLDIVLVDTAGRSPRDEVQIQELKAVLTEARADEVHLVLSSVCGARHLLRTVDNFRQALPTSLILTKLDEATGLGNLLPLLCRSKLPISYTTNGQNVPDDIQAADVERLVATGARRVPTGLQMIVAAGRADGTDGCACTFSKVGGGRQGLATMRDQADKLRSLVLKSTQDGELPTRSSRVVVLAGGKGGVGTTSLALNLAVALAESDRRVALVDADLVRADVSVLCRMRSQYDLGDVLAGKRNIRQVLQTGPSGIQIVPGSWNSYGDVRDDGETLVAHLQPLHGAFHYIVIDSGCASAKVAGCLWPAADLVLAITTSDSVAIMDAYAMIKRQCHQDVQFRMATLINQINSDSSAWDVHARIAKSCERFLNTTIGKIGHVPQDPHVPAAAAAGRSFVASYPECPASLAIRCIAGSVESMNFHSTLPQRHPILDGSVPRIAASNWTGCGDFTDAKDG